MSLFYNFGLCHKTFPTLKYQKKKQTNKQNRILKSLILENVNVLVQEQENVKRVQLAEKYLNEAALGDANEDAIKNGNFYG